MRSTSARWQSAVPAVKTTAAPVAAAQRRASGQLSPLDNRQTRAAETPSPAPAALKTLLIWVNLKASRVLVTAETAGTPPAPITLTLAWQPSLPERLTRPTLVRKSLGLGEVDEYEPSPGLDQALKDPAIQAELKSFEETFEF